MHDYFLDVETVRLAVVIGVIISTLFYERVQLTTGGAIVPGYLAIFIPAPLFIVVTLLSAYLTFFIVNRLLAKRYILYGRRKYEVEILVALVIVAAWVALAHFVVHFNPLLSALYGIGFIIPAVIAHDMFRQGLRKTLTAVLVNVAIVGLFIYVFFSLTRIAPWSGEAAAAGPRSADWNYPVDLLTLGGGDFGYSIDLLLPAIFVSVLAGVLVFARLGLRTGGFVVGAYLALVLLRPLDLLYALIISVATYFFVTKFLMNHLLIFGRRKLSMMILIASIFAWSGEIALDLLTSGQYVPWRGFHVITLMVPALLANDAQRQGIYRTLWGAGITTVAVFTVVNLLDAARLYFGL